MAYSYIPSEQLVIPHVVRQPIPPPMRRPQRHFMGAEL